MQVEWGRQAVQDYDWIGLYKDEDSLKNDTNRKTWFWVTNNDDGKGNRNTGTYDFGSGYPVSNEDWWVGYYRDDNGYKLIKKAQFCSAHCKLDKIQQNLDSNAKNILWSQKDNTAIEILAGPEKGDSDLQAPGQAMLKAVQQAIKGGEKLIDITTLSTIADGEWIGEIKMALGTVESNAIANGKSPVVRIYLGMPGFLTGSPSWFYDALKRRMSKLGLPDLGIAESNWNSHFTDLMKKLTNGLSGNSKLEIYIGGSRSSIDTNWNHSKIVAVDGDRAIVGGHNLWSDYFGETPVLDTSVKVTGDSAQSAHRYADELWKIQQEEFPIPTTHIVRWRAGTTTENVTTVPTASSLLDNPTSSGGSIKVLGVGQLGASRYPSQVESQVKTAVLNMIDAATQTIHISQQSLVHPYINHPIGSIVSSYYGTVDKAVVIALGQKAISGVDINIVLSNETAPHDTTANISNENLLKTIWYVMLTNGVANSISNRNAFCQHMKIANLRINETAETYIDSNESFANHSKTIMIDKQVFLIGSHNLYLQAPSQLSEYAYVIADVDKASEYYSSYWEPVLNYSARTRLTESQCFEAISSVIIHDEL